MPHLHACPPHIDVPSELYEAVASPVSPSTLTEGPYSPLFLTEIDENVLQPHHPFPSHSNSSPSSPLAWMSAATHGVGAQDGCPRACPATKARGASKKPREVLAAVTTDKAGRVQKSALPHKTNTAAATAAATATETTVGKRKRDKASVTGTAMTRRAPLRALISAVNSRDVVLDAADSRTSDPPRAAVMQTDAAHTRAYDIDRCEGEVFASQPESAATLKSTQPHYSSLLAEEEGPAGATEVPSATCARALFVASIIKDAKEGAMEEGAAVAGSAQRERHQQQDQPVPMMARTPRRELSSTNNDNSRNRQSRSCSRRSASGTAFSAHSDTRSEDWLYGINGVHRASASAATAAAAEATASFISLLLRTPSYKADTHHRNVNNSTLPFEDVAAHAHDVKTEGKDGDGAQEESHAVPPCVLWEVTNGSESAVTPVRKFSVLPRDEMESEEKRNDAGRSATSCVISRTRAVPRSRANYTELARLLLPVRRDFVRSGFTLHSFHRLCEASMNVEEMTEGAAAFAAGAVVSAASVKTKEEMDAPTAAAFSATRKSGDETARNVTPRTPRVDEKHPLYRKYHIHHHPHQLHCYENDKGDNGVSDTPTAASHFALPATSTDTAEAVFAAAPQRAAAADTFILSSAPTPLPSAVTPTARRFTTHAAAAVTTSSSRTCAAPPHAIAALWRSPLWQLRRAYARLERAVQAPMPQWPTIKTIAATSSGSAAGAAGAGAGGGARCSAHTGGSRREASPSSWISTFSASTAATTPVAEVKKTGGTAALVDVASTPSALSSITSCGETCVSTQSTPRTQLWSPVHPPCHGRPVSMTPSDKSLCGGDAESRDGAASQARENGDDGELVNPAALWAAQQMCIAN